MKKVIAIIALILFIIGVGVGYKLFLLNKYHIEKIVFNNDAMFNTTITVNHQDTDEKKITYNDITFKDNFSNWERYNDFYVVRGGKNQTDKAFAISKAGQYYLSLQSKNYDSEENKDLFNEDDRIKFVEENNINNDIDLLKYIKNNYYLKNSIFDSIKQYKENYMVNLFVISSVLVNSSDDNTNNSIVSLIDGDLTGYMFNLNNAKEIHLLHNNEQYIISLIGNSLITDDYVQNFLNSITFNN